MLQARQQPGQLRGRGLDGAQEQRPVGAGDFDVETFPTVLIARGDRPLFLGPVQPAPAQLARLLASLKHAQTDEAVSARGVSAEAASLLARLHARVLPKP